MRILFLFIAFTAGTNVFSQTTEPVSENSGTKARSVFVEVAGNGLMLSLNYDFRFKKQQNGFGMRIGAGYYDGGNDIYTFPVAVNYLIGKASSFFELSAGVTYLTTFGIHSPDFLFYNKTNWLLIPGVGYRLQPANKGFTGKIAFTPIFSPNGGTLPFGSLGLGYKF